MATRDGVTLTGPAAAPSVATVALHFGSPDDTVECVRSLRATGYPRLRIIVVDNGSPEATHHQLQRHLPSDVELISAPQNLGFSGGNNLGIGRALEDGADYVLLINNDATLAPAALEAMVRAAQQVPDLGLLGGKILVADADGPVPTIWSAGGFWSPLRATGYPVGIGQPDWGQFDRPGEVDYLTGCLWLVPAGIFREVGLLPEEYFAYAEDVDYCLRLRRAGLKIVYEPRAVCYHKVSRSHWQDRDRASPVLNYYTNRNRIFIARKWLSPLQRLVFYAYFLTSRPLLAVTRWDWSYMAGIADGFRGRTGPRQR